MRPEPKGSRAFLYLGTPGHRLPGAFSCPEHPRPWPKRSAFPGPRGLVTHRGVCTTIVLREPTYDEYLDLGEIFTYGKAPDGTIFPVENSEVLRSYIAKCLVEPKDALALSQGGVKLARAVKGAVEGFFRDAPSVTEPLPTSPTTSSSNASPDVSPQTGLAA